MYRPNLGTLPFLNTSWIAIQMKKNIPAKPKYNPSMSKPSNNLSIIIIMYICENGGNYSIVKSVKYIIKRDNYTIFSSHCGFDKVICLMKKQFNSLIDMQGFLSV